MAPPPPSNVIHLEYLPNAHVLKVWSSGWCHWQMVEPSGKRACGRILGHWEHAFRGELWGSREVVQPVKVVTTQA